MKERQALFEIIKLLEIYEDTEILLERLIYYVCELMNAQAGIVRLIKDGNLYVTATYNIDSSKTIINLDEGICGKVLKEGRVKTFNKAQLEGFELDIPAHSAICIPLKIQQENIGTILIYNKLDSEEGFGEFTEEDISLGELFSAIASLIILKSLQFKELRERETENIKVMTQLQELKSYLESLIQSSADAIVATDLDNIVTAWNRGAENIFGYKKKKR